MATASLSLPTEATGPVEAANGADAHRADVLVLDASGLPKAGAVALITVTGPAGDSAVMQTQPAGPDGIASTVFTTYAPGVYQVTATAEVDGVTVQAGSVPAAATFAEDPASALSVSWRQRT
ncbi:MAG: hypothetical protein LBT54_06500 [Bifidobacteriaceae bacterium]|nr:hypothetical protein [Bifidobacteriaceae bacterium]